MTKAQDIRQLIAEEALGSGERRSMEAVADTLDRSLGKDVPARPEFKAQLRRQLVAQARKNLTPWYKRPAVWGSAAGVAAAAAVLAVGLNMFDPAAPLTPESIPAPVAKGNEPVQPPQQQVLQRLTSAVPGMPQPLIADEPMAAGARPEGAVPDASQGLTVRLLSVSPDEQSLADMAVRLGFTAKVDAAGADWVVIGGARSLKLSREGEVVYNDQTPAVTTGLQIGGTEAVAVARRFLETAVLPIPEAQPVVQVNPGGTATTYRLVYTPRVGGRPVVNGRTQVTVNAFGQVVNAVAYVPAGETERGPFDAVPVAGAIEAARQRGGSFAEADLVWVRTVAESKAVYLQPYWRVFGTDAQGQSVARYVPAMKH